MAVGLGDVFAALALWSLRARAGCDRPADDAGGCWCPGFSTPTAPIALASWVCGRVAWWWVRDWCCRKNGGPTTPPPRRRDGESQPRPVSCRDPAKPYGREGGASLDDKNRDPAAQRDGKGGFRRRRGSPTSMLLRSTTGLQTAAGGDATSRC